MEETIELEKELALLQEQYDETRNNAKKYKKEKEKLQDLYVFFKNDQKLKDKNCETCEKNRYKITHYCQEAHGIINKIKETEELWLEEDDKCEIEEKRFKELEKEKEKIHKEMLWHLVFVEESTDDTYILKDYYKEEIIERELNKVKAERKKARRIKRERGVWNRKKDYWYNSDTDSDPEMIQKRARDRRKKTYTFTEKWYGDRFDLCTIGRLEDAAASKLQYSHQTVSDEESDDTMSEEIGLLECAEELRAKFSKQKNSTKRLKKDGIHILDHNKIKNT